MYFKPLSRKVARGDGAYLLEFIVGMASKQCRDAFLRLSKQDCKYLW